MTIKKALCGIMLFSALTAGAQSKKDTAKKEEIPVNVPDSIPLLEWRDFKDFDQALLQEMPAKYYNTVYQWFYNRFLTRGAEWAVKEGKTKKKAGN